MLFPEVGTADIITVYSFTSIAIGPRKKLSEYRTKKKLSEYRSKKKLSEYRSKKKLSEYRTNIVITHQSSTVRLEFSHK
jgi:hypothetical protein